MFRTPPRAVLNLLIINGLVYLFLSLVVEPKFPELIRYFLLFKSNLLGTHPNADYSQMVEELPPGMLSFTGELFNPIQLLTHFFSHTTIMHFLFNMLALYSLGSVVEERMGSLRFLQFYLFCGLLGGVFTAFLDPSYVPILGASGAICGVTVAFAMMYPDAELVIFPFPIPVRAIRFVLYFAIFSGVMILLPERFQMGISHFGHLAGMVSAVIYFYLWRATILRRKRKRTW